MNPEVVFGDGNEAQVARHVDVGFSSVKREQFGPFVHARGRGVDPRGLTPDLVDRGKPVKQQLADDDRIVAAVERKSLSDLISSLTSGRLRYALGELAALPRAAVVVEDRYSQIFAQKIVRPATVADGIAELQVRWPTVAIVFCENRKLAEEWTYRFLAAALTFSRDDAAVAARLDANTVDE